MTQWRGGAVARWHGGAVARWRGGAVARWRGGAVAQWRSGAVARWRGDQEQRGSERRGNVELRHSLSSVIHWLCHSLGSVIHWLCHSLGSVIPAKAGSQQLVERKWVPAFAGMTPLRHPRESGGPQPSRVSRSATVRAGSGPTSRPCMPRASAARTFAG